MTLRVLQNNGPVVAWVLLVSGEELGNELPVGECSQKAEN